MRALNKPSAATHSTKGVAKGIATGMPVTTHGISPSVVLLHHHDTAIRSCLAEALTAEGLLVNEVPDGDSALIVLNSTGVNAAVIDASSPGTSGFDVLKKVRNTTVISNLPILILAEGAELERVIALELGADDCLLSPFTSREVKLRVRSLLRRSNELSGFTVIRTGEFYFDALAHEVRVKDNIVRLTSAEFRLLSLLVKKQGAVALRHELVAELSRPEGHSPDYRTINTHMRRLGRKLGVAGQRLQSIRGVGYRFTINDTSNAR
jgi:DNA-binding response OmpR family regulator